VRAGAVRLSRGRGLGGRAGRSAHPTAPHDRTHRLPRAEEHRFSFIHEEAHASRCCPFMTAVSHPSPPLSSPESRPGERRLSLARGSKGGREPPPGATGSPADTQLMTATSPTVSDRTSFRCCGPEHDGYRRERPDSIREARGSKPARRSFSAGSSVLTVARPHDRSYTCSAGRSEPVIEDLVR